MELFDLLRLSAVRSRAEQTDASLILTVLLSSRLWWDFLVSKMRLNSSFTSQFSFVFGSQPHRKESPELVVTSDSRLTWSVPQVRTSEVRLHLVASLDERK